MGWFLTFVQFEDAGSYFIYRFEVLTIESPPDVIEGFKVLWDILLGLFDGNFLNIVIIILVDPVTAPVPVGMAELCHIR